MNCQESMQKAGQLLDGELSEVEKKDVLTHINSCNQCSQNFAVESQLKQTLKNKLPKKIVPDNIVNDIRTSIQKIT
jgi:mycothiol system anti-sigma-R factor